MVIAAADVNSMAKSLSDTESKEFSVGAWKPSALAVMCRSMSYDVPASAAEPRGQ